MAKHRAQGHTSATMHQFRDDFLNGVGRGMIVMAVFVLIMIYGHWL